MVDISNNFYPVPSGRAIQQQPQQPSSGKQQEQLVTPQRAKNQSQQGNKAPLNLLPQDEALERLINRAQDAQNQGQTLERGAILNLLV